MRACILACVCVCAYVCVYDVRTHIRKRTYVFLPFVSVCACVRVSV